MADHVDYPLLHITIKSVGIFSRNFHVVLHASLALHVPHFVSFSRLKLGCKNATKNRHIYLRTTCESLIRLFTNLIKLTNLLIHQFLILVISRKCHIAKDWKISLYKPGQIRACFCLMTEIADHSAQDFFSLW